MAPNKFEKHIKKQLQEREIQPSANAWETLSERLDAVSARSKKRNYFWYGMVASFAGILAVSVVYFNSKNPINNTEVQIVDTNKEVIQAKANSDISDSKQIEEVVVENDVVPPSISEEIEAVDKIEKLALKDEINIIDKINTANYVTTEKVTTPNNFEEIINTKVLEIVAVVDSIEKSNSQISEAEVDALLRKAQKEILVHKKLQESNKVDAMALLTDVEDELDQSLREKLFEKLKTGFSKNRTAIANRDK